MADVVCKHWKVWRLILFREGFRPRCEIRGFSSGRSVKKNVEDQTWRQYYRDLIGIADIRNASDKVIKRVQSFQESLRATHEQESRLSEIWEKLHSTRYYALCSSTIRRYFPPTLSNELSLLKQEQNAQRVLRECNDVERKRFLHLQAEIYRNCVNERWRHFQRLGWVVMACLVGTGVGVSGAYLSHYLWYYFFRSEAESAASQVSDVDHNQLRLAATRLSDSVQARSREFLLYLSGLHSCLRDVKITAVLPFSASLVPPPLSLADQESERYPVLASDVVSRVDHQTHEMNRLMKELKLMIDLQARPASTASSVPQSTTVIIDTSTEEESETNIWRTTLVYAMLLLLIPVALGESLS